MMLSRLKFRRDPRRREFRAVTRASGGGKERRAATDGGDGHERIAGVDRRLRHLNGEGTRRDCTKDGRRRHLGAHLQTKRLNTCTPDAPRYYRRRWVRSMGTQDRFLASTPA